MKFKPTRTIKLIGAGWDKPQAQCAGGGIGFKDCDGYAEPGKKYCAKCAPADKAVMDRDAIMESMAAPKRMGPPGIRP
jgi:Na+-translocating ferredoxin:NAD+ oxidoreductase RNF subunit RnfB